MTKEQRELLAKALDQNEDYLTKLGSKTGGLSYKDELGNYLYLLGAMIHIITKELIRLDDEKRLANKNQ